MSKPLSVMMEDAKAKLISAFGQIQQESALPAYLLEGSVLELLAEVRKRKNFEIASDIIHADGTQEDEKSKKIQ